MTKWQFIFGLFLGSVMILGQSECPDSTDADGDGFFACEGDEDPYGGTCDCEDADASIYPGAIENCDGLDTNCNGEIDEGATQTYFLDGDQDGFGDAGSALVAGCETPDGYTEDSTDCNDVDSLVNPGAEEVCDPLDVDENCNGLADEDDSTTDESSMTVYYLDDDLDGFGDPNEWQFACDDPSTPVDVWLTLGGDCDDGSFYTNPNAAEIYNDGIDQDCNGVDAVSITFNHIFGGEAMDVAYEAQQTGDGGYIMAGRTRSFGAGSDDGWLVKTNENGIEEWSQTFGTTSAEWFESVRQAGDGGYVLAGTTLSDEGTDYDFWLLKTDETGEEEWSQKIGGMSSDYGHSLQVTGDGGYILAGSTISYGAGSSDAWLVKTNGDGIKAWSKAFGGSSADFATSVQETSDSGFIISGFTGSFGAGSNDFWLIKTDLLGIEQWSRTFGDLYSDKAESVGQTEDGGFIIVGTSYVVEDSTYVSLLIKTDENGIEEWRRTFEDEGGSTPYSVQQTSDGGYVIAGQAYINATTELDLWVIKTDARGFKEWRSFHGGVAVDTARSISQTVDGGFIVAGYTDSYGPTDYDFWLIKMDPIGHAPSDP